MGQGQRRAGHAGLEPVRVPSAADEVADRLLTAIALGEFSVGERLPPERELAEQLGVSRPTVRIAVGRLREIGCLEVVRGRSGGHYVRTGWRAESADAVRRTLMPKWERVHTLQDTRCLIESLIARTAAERCGADEATDIRTALAAYESASEPAEVRSTSAGLHEAIARAAHNEPLAVYSRQLLQEITAGFPIEPYSGNLTERSLAEHRALAEAVLAGEAERAARIAREHFTITGENLRAILERSTAEPDSAS
ncbi:FadR/GntR family transcriptional regulator [Sciscionella sediminilitoris]|uniref:FadR/GntR family transcriptional regulator n=1 Tax=Sciscionella sediminilitoris TaxID=1445613 RepID=UPI00055FD2C1|nr:FCD domain-containing protein [Sciscionella sp. SE31]